MNTNENSKTVLIVDDEPDVVFVLKMGLEKNGYKTVEARNGIEALEKVQAAIPDAIILDLMMPKLDGNSVNLKLKENPQTAQIPVIIITGKGQVKELLNAREELKVAAYLEKPIPFRLLLEKLAEALKQSEVK